MAKIIIRRKWSFLACAAYHKVYLSGLYVGVLGNGDTLEIPVDVGTHAIFFKSPMKLLCKSGSFSVIVNNPDEVVKLKTRFDFNGNYKIEHDDNKPHILLCPRCGSRDMIPISELSTRGRDFSGLDACCGYMICGPIGLLCGAMGNGKQVSTDTYWLCKICGDKFKS